MTKFSRVLSIAIAVISVGCGSTTPAIVSTPIENIDTVPLKVTSLDEESLKRWNTLDLKKDTVPGMSIQKAYDEIIKNKKGKTIIVGVIDSGVDIEHEDLDDVIWTNKREKPNNNKDDDGNGYIDDVHGWNFLGDATNESYEFVRVIRDYGPKFKGKAETEIPEADKEKFRMYLDAKAEYDKKLTEAKGNAEQYEQLYVVFNDAHEQVQQALGKENYTREEVSQLKPDTPEMQQSVSIITQVLASVDPTDLMPDVLRQVKEAKEHYTESLEYNLNMEFDGRKVIGDNPNSLEDKTYGNPDVTGPSEDKKDIRHGTHVAGIIAAERNNKMGIDGVANNVQIMPIRAVPNGDEYDKDIALAIRYATDNGAKVINTSFGKYFSPHHDWVEEAIQYAADKDVLIVNAAGNEGLDIDQKPVYPNDQNQGKEIADNFLTVGALNYTYGPSLVTDFSNYGKSNVDVFAPGAKIWSTTPNNTYDYLDGTSMAAPQVAGVAAIIRSYYPNLSAAQVKKVIMDSAVSTNATVLAGGQNSKKLTELSRSGAMANLYNALILADKVAKEPQKS